MTEEAKRLSPSAISRGSICTVMKMTESIVLAGMEIGLEVNAENT